MMKLYGLMVSILFSVTSLFATPPIVIGMSCATSGHAQYLGKALSQGSSVYFDYVNRHGGIYGRPIQLIIKDDGYDPIRAVQNTVWFIQNNVDLLYGFVGTPTVTRVLPLLKLYQDRPLYLFFPFTGAQPQREPPYGQFVYNLRASYQQETMGLVDHFVKLNRKRIAVFYQLDAYGRSGWNGIRKGLEKYGLDIAAEATYKRGSSFEASYMSPAKIIAASQPDAVITIGAYEACAGFIRDARDIGLDVPIANISFVNSESLLKLVLDHSQKTEKDYTLNLINSQVVPHYEDSHYPAVKEYQELMSGLHDPLYGFVSFEGFLNAKLLVHILKKAGPDFDRKTIADAVQIIQNYDLGIHSPITFSRERRQGLDRVYYMTVYQERFVEIKDWSQWKK